MDQSNLPAALAPDRGALEVAVAVPANAHGPQRFLTLDAFRRAGFEVRALLNEPSAAGFEYTHRFRKSLSTRREHIVVYDSAAVPSTLLWCACPSSTTVPATTAGVNQLGGDDFDQVLLGLAVSAAGLPSSCRASGPSWPSAAASPRKA